jgi:23S rRNA (uracil1939-C5)-methyltransferase
VKTATVQATGIAHGGDAVARHEGKVIFVPYLIPGEEALVEIVEEKTNFSRAWPVEIISASRDRVEALCNHFGVCGGCQWQHISYKRQLALRQEILQSQVARIGSLPEAKVKPAVPSPEPWYYRNNVQLHVDDEGRLGFIEAKRNRILPISECHIMQPLVWETWSALEIDFPGLQRVTLRASATTREQLVVLESSGEEVPEVELDLPVSCVLMLPDGTPITYVGTPYITEEVRGRTFRISANSFFQVNTAQLHRLVSIVEEYAEPRGSELVLDVYCGVGTLGLSLADKIGRLLGIDETESAIEDAWFNGQQYDNVAFLQGSAEHLVSNLEEKPDLVLLDPPRRGVSKRVIDAILERAPDRVIYVSCDPATLARDLGIMVQGGYELVEIQPVDMFPQTYHVEAVALIRRAPQ